MEMNTSDDEATTWLRSSLRATEVTFTPWQEAWWAISLPIHIHGHTCHDRLRCSQLSAMFDAGCTLACVWRKTWSPPVKQRCAVFSICSKGTRLFCSSTNEPIWTVFETPLEKKTKGKKNIWEREIHHLTHGNNRRSPWKSYPFVNQDWGFLPRPLVFPLASFLWLVLDAAL